MYRQRLIPPSSPFHAPADLIFNTLPRFASRRPPLPTPLPHTHTLSLSLLLDFSPPYHPFPALPGSLEAPSLFWLENRLVFFQLPFLFPSIWYILLGHHPPDLKNISVFFLVVPPCCVGCSVVLGFTSLCVFVLRFLFAQCFAPPQLASAASLTR